MITIEWYNVVAIFFGVAALISMIMILLRFSKKQDLGGGVEFIFSAFVWIFVVSLFFSLWGGMYWW